MFKFIADYIRLILIDVYILTFLTLGRYISNKTNTYRLYKITKYYLFQ